MSGWVFMPVSIDESSGIQQRHCYQVTLKLLVNRSIRAGHVSCLQTIHQCGVAAEDFGHGLEVFDHHTDVGVFRVAWISGEVVVAQGADKLDADLAADLFDDGGGEDLRAKDGGYAAFAQLVYEGGDFLAGGFGEIGGLDGAEDRVAVAGGEVGEGVVVGIELAVFGGDAGGRGLNGSIECIDACGELVIVGLVGFGVVGVVGGQLFAYDFGVLACENGVGPEMGIGAAGLFGEGEIENVVFGVDDHFTEEDDLAAGLQIGRGHLHCGLFQVEPVDEDEVGAGQGDCVGGGEFEGMGVGAGGHEAGQFDMVAADVVDDVGDGGDGGDDVQASVLGLRADCSAGGEEGHDGQEKESPG